MPYYDGDWYSTLRMEAVFAYHEEPRGTHTHTKTPPEKAELTGESAVRSFAFEFDLHDRENRWMPGLRYLNYEGEEKHARWQYRPKGIDALWEEFEDVPDAGQALCWNSPNDSIPWKANWHYARNDLNLDSHQYDELQVNDVTFDLSALHSEAADEVYEPDMMTTPWPHIDGLLNPMLTIQTNKDTRSFLYVDSYALSAEV